MLTYRLLHPEILAALAAAGHGSRVLIADGNYALATNTSDRARRVFLNLAPDLVRVTDVLGVLAEAIPIEAAHVMVPDEGGEPDDLWRVQVDVARARAVAAGPVRLLRRRPRTRPRVGHRDWRRSLVREHPSDDRVHPAHSGRLIAGGGHEGPATGGAGRSRTSGATQP